jgi:hypothetical protein
MRPQIISAANTLAARESQRLDARELPPEPGEILPSDSTKV